MEKNIIALLNNNLRVIIPDFGAFIIRQKEPRIIVFNEFLRYNDGLLIDFIAKAEGIDRDIAEQRVLSFSDDGNRVLDSEKEFNIKGLGSLRKDSSGKITFIDESEIPEPPESEPAEKKEPAAEIPSEPIKEPTARLEETELKNEPVSEPEPEPVAEPVIESPVAPPVEESVPEPVQETPIETVPEIPAEPELVPGAVTESPAEPIPVVPAEPETPAAAEVVPVVTDTAPETPPVIKERPRRRPRPEVPAHEQPKEEVILPPPVTPIPEPKPVIPAKARLPKPPEYQKVVHDEIPERGAKNKTNRILLWVGVILFINIVILAWFVFKGGKSKRVEKIVQAVATDSLYKQLADSVKAAAMDTTLVFKENPTVPEATTPAKNAAAGSRYYIVAGCFRDEVNADAFVKSLKKRGFSAEKFGKIGNLFAVCFASFDDKDKAVTELKKIREKVPDAWMTRF